VQLLNHSEDVKVKQHKNGILQWLNDRIFGYDFFISYSHNDGLFYPATLNERLKQLGFKVFLDKTEYVAGVDLRQATVRRVSMSQKLIVIGRPAAFNSEWVYREVEVYLKKGNPPILVNINNSLEEVPQDALLANLAREHHWLRIEEQLLDADSLPTDQCIHELTRSFDASRVETRRSRIFGATAVVFALIALFAGWQAYRAVTQRNRAERVLDRVAETSNDLVFELAQQFRGRFGIPQTLIIDILDQAKTLVDELAKTGESRPDILRSQGIAFAELSSTLRSQGQAQKALAAAEAAVSIFESLSNSQNPDPEWESFKGVSYDRLGDALFLIGEYDKALSAYEKSFTISKKLADSNQYQVEWQHNLAVSYEKIGNIDLYGGEVSKALERYQKSQEIREKLKVANSDRTEWRRDLAALYARIAKAYRQQDRNSKALAAYQKSLSITEEIAAAHELRADWQRDLSVNYQEIGDVLSHEGRYIEALEYYQKDLAIAKKLNESDPHRVDWQDDLLRSYSRLGSLYIKIGKSVKALDAHKHGLSLAKALSAFDRKRTDWREVLCVMYQKMALTLFELKRFTDALQIAEESVEALKPFTDVDIDVALDLADAQNNVAWYALFNYEFEKARHAADQAIAAAPQALSVRLNKAHALMFLDRTEEATSIYLSHQEETVNDGMSWKQAVRSDFSALQKAGLYNSLMDRIKEELNM
jgi:tetratricopeptide (TPR) repeat protein